MRARTCRLKSACLVMGRLLIAWCAAPAIPSDPRGGTIDDRHDPPRGQPPFASVALCWDERPEVRRGGRHPEYSRWLMRLDEDGIPADSRRARSSDFGLGL